MKAILIIILALSLASCDKDDNTTSTRFCLECTVQNRDGTTYVRDTCTVEPVQSVTFTDQNGNPLQGSCRRK